MKIILSLALAAVAFAFAPSALAQDEKVFDSTDNYLGACQRTDASEWTLTEDLDVSTFQLWYYWSQGETSVPVTVTKDGKDFATFEATRGACDPYQQQWCNADFSLNKTMPAGTYTTKVPNAQQCLKPGGTGTVRLYGTVATAANAVEPAVTAAPATTKAKPQTTTTTSQPVATASCTTPVLIWSIGAFVLGAIVFFFIGRMTKRSANR